MNLIFYTLLIISILSNYIRNDEQIQNRSFILPHVSAFPSSSSSLISNRYYKQASTSSFLSNGTDFQKQQQQQQTHDAISGGGSPLSRRLFYGALGRSLLSSNVNNHESEKADVDTRTDIIIEKARYKDLTSITKIIVDSFYERSPLLRHYYFFKELDRLQSNFPYNDKRHTMYVARSTTSSSDDDDVSVVGFVDIDLRPPKSSDAWRSPPRPYLSDLAVDVNYRRRGIAKRLIGMCERMVRDNGGDCLHLRVEFKNEVAMRMYHSLGYEVQESEIFGVVDTTVLLKKMLLRVGEEDESGGRRVMSAALGRVGDV